MYGSCFLMQYIVSFLVLQLSRLREREKERERDGYFYLIVF